MPDLPEPNRVSLHRRIVDETEAKILSGAWAPGDRIPFETELAAHYGCSRMTVNKALSQLAKAGLIERRRRSGSFVKPQHSQSAVLEIQDIEAEVAALGRPYRFAIVRRRVQRRVLAAWPEGGNGPMLHLDCCHFAGSRPFCLEERFIGLAVVPEAEAEPFEAQPPGTWLVRRIPWSAAEHRIRAVAADTRTAALLRLAEGAPCLAIERKTWSAERPVTFVRFTYPGTAHALIARFSPSRN